MFIQIFLIVIKYNCNPYECFVDCLIQFNAWILKSNTFEDSMKSLISVLLFQLDWVSSDIEIQLNNDKKCKVSYCKWPIMTDLGIDFSSKYC